MAHTRLVACVFIMLASSVSGCMSQAKLAYYTEREGNQPNGKPLGIAVSIPERTDTWPYYHTSEAKAFAEKTLNGPVEEVKPDPTAKLGPNDRLSDGKIVVKYRLKQPTDPSKMIGQQPARQPSNPVIQTGGIQQPGRADVISPYPPGAMPTGSQGFNPPLSGYPPMGGNDPFPGQQQPPFVSGNPNGR